MGKQFPKLLPEHHQFIARQHIFFTATSAGAGRINISPRGTDGLRVLGDEAVVYLDRTGSGNETAAHVRRDGRMTIMFCAVEGPPKILRLYGRGRIIARGGAEYAELLSNRFDGAEPPGVRKMVRLDFDLVQTSCGYGVPLFSYVGQRDTLDRWAAAKGKAGIEAYWQERNAVSLDGWPTGLDDLGDVRHD